MMVFGRRGVAAGCAGQGAHREVESEGFAAKRRTVADIGEPVGQVQVIPSRHYGGEGNTWGAWAQQGVCGRHGAKVPCVTPGGLVRSPPTGMIQEKKPGAWARPANMGIMWSRPAGTWQPLSSDFTKIAEEDLQKGESIGIGAA